MTNAPTTGETADHAELARTLEALAVEASASRNIHGAESMMVSVQTIYDLIVNRNALLSEIAALRGEKDRVGRVLTTMQEAIPAGYHPNGSGLRLFIADLKDRATQAERQRDELRKALEAVISDCNLAAAACDNDGPRAGFQHIASDVIQALANQGADQ